MKKFLYWAPRALSILLAAFTSVFAADIFCEGYKGWELVLAFIMHSIPTILAVIFVIIAWKWEQIGGWLFVALGIGYLFIGGFELMAILIFSVPLILIGGLFLVYYYKYKKNKTVSDIKEPHKK